MEEFYYDSADSRCKLPFGAVRTEQDIVITVFISEKVNPRKVSLVLLGEVIPAQKFVMQLSSEEHYSVTFAVTQAGLYFYHFEIETDSKILTAGHKNRLPIISDNADLWQLTVFEKDYNTPASFRGKIMYQIFPDRFCKGEMKEQVLPQKRTIHQSWDELPESCFDTQDYKATDFFGGNLNGMINMLPYLKRLHVDCIYLNPIFESASNHRYNTGNYRKIDPLLGTDEDFQRFCWECEKSGIKVILDGVFSHTGSDSIYFNKEGNYPGTGAYQSKQSPYYPWYRFKKYPDDYDCWWGFPTLPNVNETEESYLDYILNTKTGVLAKWQALGASGWRLDVADELPDLFLDKLRKTVKTLDSEALIIGEVWEDASNKTSYGERRRYLLGKQLDSVMNYPFRDAILEFVKDGDALHFWQSILPILENYPKPSLDCLMNSLSTHDTVRAITELAEPENIPPEKWGGYVLPESNYFLGVERFKLASFLQFTLPGIPCIYYGDEVGLYGFRDPFNRMPYPYGREDLNLLSFFEELTGFRHQFEEQFCEKLYLNEIKNGVFSFYRGNLLCCINTSETVEELTVDCDIHTVYVLRAVVDGNKISLPPMSFGAFLSNTNTILK